MPRYKVNKRYAAMYNATRLEYVAGAEVDLPEQQADWVNRDCPGTLTLVEPEPEAAAEEAAAAELGPETDEQGSSDEEPDAGEQPAAEPEKPRNRKHTPAKVRQ